MRFLLSARVPVVVLTCAFGALAQQLTCPIKNAPSFRGYRLGMLVSDVRMRLDDATMLDAAASSATGGLMTASIAAAQLKGDDAEGIDNIAFSFVDGRLAVIKTTFNGPGDSLNSRDFFARVSDSMGLPKASDPNAITGSGGNEKYRFDCGKFSVVMAYSFGVSPVVTLYDPLVQKIVDDRRDKENTKTMRVGPGGTTTIPARRAPLPPPQQPPPDE